MSKIKKNQRVTIREMDTVGRGLLGKRDKNNPQMKFTFSTIKKVLWRRRKSAPICVKHSVYIEIKKREHFLANIMKTISDIFKQESFKRLNGIVGRHRGKDVMFVNENHHFGFPSQTKCGHIAMIPFVNELSVSEISDRIKECIYYELKHEKQWFYIDHYDTLQKKKEIYFPTLALTDWYSINIDSGFLPISNFSSPPITFGYTRKEIFVVYDHLFFSGAIIGKFLNAVKEELKKWE